MIRPETDGGQTIQFKVETDLKSDDCFCDDAANAKVGQLADSAGVIDVLEVTVKQMQAPGKDWCQGKNTLFAWM